MKWRLGVAGFPIEHSLSPRLHEVGLTLAGLEGTSARVALHEDETATLRALMGGQFDALSITMPLKGVAAGICDALDDAAARTGVVNSLLARDGQLLGACTDGQGFIDAVRCEFDFSVEGANVVVLGAGGAARAIVDALVHADAHAVAVHGRSPVHVTLLTERYDVVVDQTQPMPSVDLIVNTTPAAGRPARAEVASGVSGATLAVDITYEPRRSTWRSAYEDVGCASANGLAMLAYQAALQMQWWWNTSIDGAKLLETLR
jgi:shikimate dehydrogenase